MTGSMTQWMRVAWFEELVRAACDGTMEATVNATIDDAMDGDS